MLPRHEEYRGQSISNFLEQHPNGKYIIRIDGHLTWANNGQVYDIWDCSDKTIDIVWEVRE